MVLKDPTTGTPFPDNIIPVSQLSPNGMGILKAYPLPNINGFLNGNQNWVYAAAPSAYTSAKIRLSADLNRRTISASSSAARTMHIWEYQPTDGGTNQTPRYFNRPNQTNSLNYIWTISPTMVNEVLATVSLDDVYIPVDRRTFSTAPRRGSTIRTFSRRVS